LSPSAGTSKVFALSRGTIKEIHVHEGDLVRQGDPLLTIETSQIAADGVDVNASMTETLEAQQTLLKQNVTAEEQRANSEQQRLQSLQNGLGAEIKALQQQIELQSTRLNLAEADFAAGKNLRAKGFMTAVEFNRRQAVFLEQKQVIQSLHQQLADKENQLNESKFSLQQLPTLMAQKVQTLKNDLAVTEQRLAEAQGRRAYIIRAPKAGRVSTVQATLGQSVDPQRLQLEIIPRDAVLQAELFVPARAIGLIEIGQRVRLLYDAFPYQHFGTYSGHVIQISKTLLTNSEVSGPMQLREPAYRVTAALDRSDIDAYHKKIPLQPDMFLKADIILEKRPLVAWLFSPFRVRM
jgi:membrane fusion protein